MAAKKDENLAAVMVPLTAVTKVELTAVLRVAL